MTPLERMAWPYGWFAERYGWPPDVVDRQPLPALLQFPVYAGVVDDAKAIQQQRADAQRAREAQAEANRRR